MAGHALSCSWSEERVWSDTPTYGVGNFLSSFAIQRLKQRKYNIAEY